MSSARTTQSAPLIPFNDAPDTDFAIVTEDVESKAEKRVRKNNCLSTR
ncbi:hypothetical protein IFVP69_C1110172 [Vibrio parahaemolyticus]